MNCKVYSSIASRCAACVRPSIRRRYAALLALALLPTVPLGAQSTSYEVAVRAWHAGAYEDAIRGLEDLANHRAAPPEVHRAYARVLVEVGRSSEARQHLREVGGAEIANVLGEVLLVAGRGEEAEQQFRIAVEAAASDIEVARVNLAELLWDRGRHAEALPMFASFIDLYNSSRRLDAYELMAVGRAVRRLAVTNPQLFQDALLAFDRAAEAAPQDPLPRVLAGELFLEKYNGTEAHQSFRDALHRNPRHPRALLGVAGALDFGNEPGAADAIRDALETNPRSAPAFALRARLALSGEDFRSAVEAARSALEINPNSPEALAILGAAHFLVGNKAEYTSARLRALAINPAAADFYTTVADMAARHRRYQVAVEMAMNAAELDSLHFAALGLLGMNQTRIGAIEDGRANLERAFEGDPYNPWFKNSLDLLDTFAEYESISTSHFVLFLREDEADLLAPYVEALAEEAFDSLTARYGTEPSTPIRVELFPRHADFSVRTLGLTGLGALGVAFGSVLAMDSPSALESGEFNWGSTLWHEIAHAFHLGMTDNKVPRWFSEGLAVHEQRAARPGWGHAPALSFFQAYEAGRVPPASELNRGFMRPEYPEQVVHSYFMASLVFAWMEQEHGTGAALSMLDGYKEDRSTQGLVREVLGLSLSALDRVVDRYIRDRFADAFRAIEPVQDTPPRDGSIGAWYSAAARHPGSFALRLVLGQKLVAAERYEEAETELLEALRLFPAYPELDGPYLYLARIYRERGELGRAAGALARLGALSEDALEVHLLEAEVRTELGDRAGAAAALERTLLIQPYDVEVHERLAELYEELEAPERVVRERRAILALDPVDLAEAQYRMGRALLGVGQNDEARRAVLRALEVAPTYQAALDLLLELRGTDP